MSKVVAIVLAVVVGGVVLLAVIGLVAQALGYDPDRDQADAASTTTSAAAAATTAPTSSSAAALPPASTSESPRVAESTPAPAPAPGQPAADPRCTPAAAAAVAAVEAGLTKPGYRLTNATVIEAGGLTYLGATIVDGGGATKERSDVWVLRDGVPYASTGGARNNSRFAKASDALDVSSGDEPVQAVDRCVVAITQGR